MRLWRLIWLTVFEKVDGAAPLRVKQTAHPIELVVIVAEVASADHPLICFGIRLTDTLLDSVLDSRRRVCLLERAHYLAQLMVRH